MLHFDHAQIALGLVVVKRDRKIVQEPQHSLLLLREAIQQIARRTLFGLTWSWLLRGWSKGIGLVAFREQLLIAPQQTRQGGTSRWWLPAALACSTSAFISKRSSFIFLAQACLWTSSRKVSSRK